MGLSVEGAGLMVEVDDAWLVDGWLGSNPGRHPPTLPPWLSGGAPLVYGTHPGFSAQKEAKSWTSSRDGNGNGTLFFVRGNGLSGAGIGHPGARLVALIRLRRTGVPGAMLLLWTL